MDNTIRSFKEVFPGISIELTPEQKQFAQDGAYEPPTEDWNTVEERARQEVEAIRKKHSIVPANTSFCWANHPNHTIGWFCQHPDCVNAEECDAAIAHDQSQDHLSWPDK